MSFSSAFVPAVRRDCLRHYSYKMSEDPFGDDSFLAEIDLDAVILANQRQRQRSGTTASNYSAKKQKTLFGANYNGPDITMGQKTDPSNMTFAYHELPVALRESTNTTSAQFVGTPTATLATTTTTTTTMKNTPKQQPSSSNHSLPIHSQPAPSALEETLLQYFGHDKFRSGQLDVITAVLGGRDAAVFWATGSGKSMCYQIPALHSKGVAIVISPLISLMQDQVHKLNGLSDAPLATFLGSGQMDPHAESGALNGDYQLVYVTPEKLLSAGFLEALAHMHQKKRTISLMAVDEAHCVSEWGHDFRTDFRNLHLIRSHPVLKHVPILALTATAVPRVQIDILSSLRLQNPYIARQTFDRTNLEISVVKKHRGGIGATLETVLPKLKDNKSTIIYAATKNEVEDIAAYLDSKGVSVQPYHAGLTTKLRTDAHTNFLIGKTDVLVGTVAFGMGIDKPDTRRVIHYGPPKTMEEYYQQIGRAGRDGLASEVCMFVNDNDFDKYYGDFYMGSLPAEAKQAMEGSLSALKTYALDPQTCRRKAVLDFFEEKPSFGERCGTCDTCRNVKKYGSEMERDLGKMGARVVLKAVESLSEQSLSIIEKVINGNTVESYRYSKYANTTAVNDYIVMARKDMGKRRPISYFKELVSPLVSAGYLSERSKKIEINGYKKAFTVFLITPKGLEALQNEELPIILSVPQSLRDFEEEEERARQTVLAQLEKSGIKLEKIPKEEIESGEGITIQAYSKWNSHIESHRKNNRQSRIQQLEDLLGRIELWRRSTAEKFRMAPAAVLAEHITYTIAYAIATMNGKVEREALVAVGVRSRELDNLLQALHEWQDEVQPQSPFPVKIASGTTQMVLPNMFTPTRAWEYAVYRPNKKTGLASWESSHNRFVAGEHLQTIAMSPAGGKPVTATTVFNHVLEGLVMGRGTPLKRLASHWNPPPTEEVYNRLKECESLSGMDPVGMPATSGKDGGKFLLTDFLRPIIGDELADKPYETRTFEDKKEINKWYSALNWYLAFRRAGYDPSFAPPDEQLPSVGAQV